MFSKKFSLVELELSNSSQTILNMFANALSFAVSLGISFFLSPYIVKNLGADANGFITLATNFTSYAALVVSALNSMGSRFITISYHRGELNKANKYFSSLFIGDLILGAFFLIIGLVCVWQLENLINIPNNLVSDVKILFLLIFCCFIMNTITTVFTSAPYIKNKLYLQYIRDVQSYLVRGSILIILFSVLEPKIFFLGIATLIPNIIVIIYNIYYKSKLVPELKIKKKYFSLTAIKELLSQGIWSSISSVGTILMNGLDLLIANLFVGSQLMGILSVAKTLPNIIWSLSNSISSVFYPNLLKFYANNDIKALTTTVKQATKIIVLISSIPTCFLIVFGFEFYSLWQPTLDAKTLQILSILTCLSSIFICAGSSISNIFMITLHVKENSISIIITGILSTVITLVLVKFTPLGIYAIAGVSSLLGIIRAIVYSIPQSGKFLNEKKTIFYSIVLNTLKSNISLCIFGLIMKQFVLIDSWFNLIINAIIFAICSFIINILIVLNKKDRKLLYNLLIQKLKIKNQSR